MKSIKEYLEIMRSNSQYIDKSYVNKYDLEDLQILDSLYYMNDYNSNIIFENHSIFPKCREITQFITFLLVNFKLNVDDSILLMCNDIDELKNDYFNTIYINYIDIDDNAQYELDNDGLDEDKFDYITINIRYDLNKDDIYDKVEHELTHAYEDLQ